MYMAVETVALKPAGASRRMNNIWSRAAILPQDNTQLDLVHASAARWPVFLASTVAGGGVYRCKADQQVNGMTSG